MIKIFLLISCIAVASACTAQQKELDSLLRLLKTHQQDDEVKCAILNGIAMNYSDIDPEQGLQFADKALLLAQRLGNTTNMAKAYSNKGLNYIRLGSDTLAEEMLHKQMELCKMENDKKGNAVALYQLAQIYSDRGECYAALKNLETSKAFFENDDQKYLKSVLTGIGNVYYSLSNYNKAFEYYFSALRVSEKAGDSLSIGNTLRNIGVLYNDIGKYQKALEYHQRALALHEKAGNKTGIAIALESIGNVYDNLFDSVNSQAYYRRALSINRSTGNKTGIAGTLSNLGISYYYEGNYAEAMKYFPEAVSIYEELDEKSSLSTLLNIMADTYLNTPDTLLQQWGINAKDRYAKANAYNLRALNLAKQAESLVKQDEILQSMIAVYEKQKDYAKVIAAYKQLLPLHDSVVNNQKGDEITRQELKFDFDKKEAVAAAEIRRQQIIKNSSITGGAVLLVAAFITFIFYKKRRDASEKLTAAEFKAQVSDVEMKALRSQMNPHFIFNSLHSINRYMIENEKESASEYLSKFSKLMRLILENSRGQEITLEKDLSALELYMQLESLRFKDRFKYSIDVDPAISIENTLVPPMLLQPFVENSIIHGISNKNDGVIKIKVYKEEDFIRCVVEDNGIGRQQSLKIQQGEKKQESLGMKITQERLHILNQLKNVQSAVAIFDLKDTNNNPSGLRIELSLPFEQAF